MPRAWSSSRSRPTLLTRSIESRWARSATTPAATGSSAGAPRTGGTLNLYGADPTTLDPAISGDADSHQYVMEIFSGLVKLDQNMKPVPDIASNWTISNDGKTYTFTLRPGVKFSNGKTMTSADVKFSIDDARAQSQGWGYLDAAIKSITTPRSSTGAKSFSKSRSSTCLSETSTRG